MALPDTIAAGTVFDAAWGSGQVAVHAHTTGALTVPARSGGAGRPPLTPWPPSPSCSTHRPGAGAPRRAGRPRRTLAAAGLDAHFLVTAARPCGGTGAASPRRLRHIVARPAATAR
ncbi:MAG: hypothetical protein R2851_04825 [Caldilineaceae bacterium]